MEEILASIRRIIADDDANKPAKVPKPPTAKPSPVTPAATPPMPSLPPAPAPAALGNSRDDIRAVDDPSAASSGSDAFDLTEAMAAGSAASPGPASAFRAIDATSDMVSYERPPDVPVGPALRIIEEARRPPLPPTSPLAAATPPQPSSDRGLISSSTMAAVDSAFHSLAHTVLGQNARTLEDLVKEMLRPMLKSWLDDNLPSLVERIVRAEIERVSRGRG
jgi:cell pole-organizing protein PopZ